MRDEPGFSAVLSGFGGGLAHAGVDVVGILGEVALEAVDQIPAYQMFQQRELAAFDVDLDQIDVRDPLNPELATVVQTREGRW